MNRTRAELALDRCASPTIGPRRWGAYFVCGFIGYVAGLALVTVLGERLGLGASARLTIALAPPLSLLLLIKAIELAIGYERIVFYEQAIAAVALTALGAALGGNGVATAVDLATLGIGTFLAFGRIGCFRVACCHGRPSRFGVAYRHEHAEAGFPRHWVGHRLFPIQLVDGALSAILVAAGTAAVLRGEPAGTAAAIYACGYAVGRFALEFARGDEDRPYAFGVSQAQWTAIATAAAAAVFCPVWWSIASAAAVSAGGAVLVTARLRGAWPRLWLFSGPHLAEIAAQVDRLARGEIDRATTREGLELSAGLLPDGRLDLVASRPGSQLAPLMVDRLATQLGGPWREREVLAGHSPGVFHILLRG